MIKYVLKYRNGQGFYENKFVARDNETGHPYAVSLQSAEIWETREEAEEFGSNYTTDFEVIGLNYKIITMRPR